MTQISIQPKQLDLSLYSGDAFGIVLQFIVKSSSEPWDARGEWHAHIRDLGGAVITEFDINLSEAIDGRVYLYLTGEQTEMFTSGLWDLQQLPGPRTWYRGAITITKDVTRP